jgi:hypothetical protein
MKRYVKPATSIPPALAPPPETGEPLDVQKLLDKSALILQREIQNLLSASAGGKLESASARDLVAYVKLLHELKKAEQDAAEAMSDEQLLAIAAKKSE